VNVEASPPVGKTSLPTQNRLGFCHEAEHTSPTVSAYRSSCAPPMFVSAAAVRIPRSPRRRFCCLQHVRRQFPCSPRAHPRGKMRLPNQQGSSSRDFRASSITAWLAAEKISAGKLTAAIQHRTDNSPRPILQRDGRKERFRGRDCLQVLQRFLQRGFSVASAIQRHTRNRRWRQSQGLHSFCSGTARSAWGLSDLFRTIAGSRIQR